MNISRRLLALTFYNSNCYNKRYENNYVLLEMALLTLQSWNDFHFDTLLRLREMQNALQLPVFFFFLFSAYRIRDIRIVNRYS